MLLLLLVFVFAFVVVFAFVFVFVFVFCLCLSEIGFSQMGSFSAAEKTNIYESLPQQASMGDEKLKVWVAEDVKLGQPWKNVHIWWHLWNVNTNIR